MRVCQWGPCIIFVLLQLLSLLMGEGWKTGGDDAKMEYVTGDIKTGGDSPDMGDIGRKTGDAKKNF